jgi:hypothetical protein
MTIASVIAVQMSIPSSAEATVRREGLVRLVSADDPACKPVFDAMDKVLDVPTHEFMTRTAGKSGGSKVSSSELISVNGSRFVMVNGKWHKSMTTAQLREQEMENRKNAKAVACKKLRGDSVNGEGATVYSMHSETEDLKSDGTIWISNARGLPLKEELVLDADDPNAEHVSVRFEYGNVQAPQL